MRRAPSIALALLALIATPAAAQVIHVDDTAVGANDGTSWQDAFTDLQSALAVAGPTQEVWVARGTYEPTSTLDRFAAFELECRLYGGFAGTESSLAARAGLFAETILTGDLLGDDGPNFAGQDENSEHVLSVPSWSLHPKTLDGFTVRGGNARLGLYPYGGGLYVDFFTGDVLVRNCTFVACQAVRGGGIGCWGETPVAIERCVFLDNRALTFGGGVDGGMSTRIRSSSFLGNRAGVAGGGLYFADTAVDCVFAANHASRAGGGAFFTARVTHCTFSANVAQVAGGMGGGFPWSPSRVDNSVLWGNVDASGSLQSGQADGWVVLDHSLVQGWDGTMPGAGTIDADPLFRDPLGPDGVAGTPDDDLRPERGSPCVDTASTGGYAGLGVDAYGRARFVNSLQCDGGIVSDRGAIERQVVDTDTEFCDSTPSSLGLPARISGACVARVSDGVFTITAQPVPDGRAFLLIGAPGVAQPFGDGNLCLAGSLARLGPVVPTLGTAAFSVDPTPLLPGATLGLQVLFRDAAAGGAGFNLSSAMRFLALP